MESREVCSGVGVGVSVGVGLVNSNNNNKVGRVHSNEMDTDSESLLPSPQVVGREFVRQYYTLLNQSPLHLHRFYSSNSSFIHGGLSEAEDGGEDERLSSASPVTGQKQIHEKIMSLNFRDCHAKIRQVDAHATLDSGVVVQVSGELSNNGGPMRRFMQTFVLAPQSPKKYYVHNDIFRYQDEVFSDEDHETPDHPPLSNQTSAEDEQQIIPNIKSRGVVEENQEDKSAPPNKNASEEVMLNGKVPPGGGKEMSSLPDVTSSTSNIISNNVDVVSNVIRPQKQSEGRTSSTSEKEAVVAGKRDEEELMDGSQSSDTTVNSGPITYAKLVKNGPSAPLSLQGFSSTSSFSSSGVGSNTNASGGNNLPLGHFGKFKGSSTGSVNSSPSQIPNSNSSTPEVKDSANGSVKASMPNNNSSFRGGVGRGSGVVGRNSFNRDRYGSTREMEDERPRGSPRLSGSGGPDRGGTASNSSVSSSSNSGPFSDSQQLFVGNLPHNCSGSDLQALFAKFGKVIEIRINGRGTSLAKTNPSGMRVPNYGFVVFEDENSVTECLKKKPIFLPEGNHRLNIEEKKTNKGRNDDMRNVPISSGCRSSIGSNFERGSQDLIGGGSNSGRSGPNMSDRGNLRGISRLNSGTGGRGRGAYSGHQGANRGGGPGSGGLGGGGGGGQQRGGYSRRS